MKRYPSTAIAEMAEILKNNGTISVPTDTVYGVCARMFSQEAQNRLRQVKNRPLEKAFPIMCKDLAQIEEIAYVDDRAKKLIQAFMPGPVTFILKKKESIPGYVNGGMTTLAVRMATSDALADLIGALQEPVYMTSANQSGHEVSKNLDEIEESCPLLDGMMEGVPAFGQSSTILDCTKDELVILREGPISLAQFHAVIK